MMVSGPVELLAMLMASSRLIFAPRFCKTAAVAVGAWHSLSATSLTTMGERAMRPSSASTRIGQDRRRAATAEPLGRGWLPVRTFWKPDLSHRNKDADAMMFISLSILGQREKKPPTA